MTTFFNNLGLELPIRMAILILLFSTSADLVMAQELHKGSVSKETYISATIDANGYLSIVTVNGKRVLIRKGKKQTAFSTPQISSAKTAVAAQAMFGNCCTSYDIPLQLVVYSGGKVHRFKGVGWPIFEWGFADSGSRIAYGQETVHYACETHYELRDIETERLIEAIDVPQSCGQDPDPKPVKIPDWVASLISRKQ